MSATTTVEPVETPWPEIERQLLHGERPPPPPFPLELLPPAWRGWVEAAAQSLTSVDYVAVGVLGAVAAVCGGRMVAKVTPQWLEPLMLWQALVGEPSTGKTPALVMARELADRVESDNPNWKVAEIDPSVDALAHKAFDSPAGVTLWCDDLAGWLADISRPEARRLALAGWTCGAASLPKRGDHVPLIGRFPLSVVGTLQADRLSQSLRDDDGAASRFLYAWPVPPIDVMLGGPPADHDRVWAMLRGLAAAPGSRKAPHPLPFLEAARENLQTLLPSLHRFRRDADGLEAAWIGKAPGNIVRLAGLLCLMDWGQQKSEQAPAVEERHVERAHALWADYFWPHAQAVFGQAGTTLADRQARRVARWLRRMHADTVSREEIRREALCQTVDADTADALIERLERHGVLRPLADDEPARRGPRKRRWAVNPELWAN